MCSCCAAVCCVLCSCCLLCALLLCCCHTYSDWFSILSVSPYWTCLALASRGGGTYFFNFVPIPPPQIRPVPSMKLSLFFRGPMKSVHEKFSEQKFPTESWNKTLAFLPTSCSHKNRC
ncbi:unnamed protein product [Scytosiphon promiscuus]